MSITKFLSSETPGSPGRYVWGSWNRQIRTQSEQEMNYHQSWQLAQNCPHVAHTSFEPPPVREVHNLTSWTSLRSPAIRSLESERLWEFSNRWRFDGPNGNPRFPCLYGSVHWFDRLPGGGGQICTTCEYCKNWNGFMHMQNDQTVNEFEKSQILQKLYFLKSQCWQRLMPSWREIVDNLDLKR